jgi:hypothetical protein
MSKKKKFIKKEKEKSEVILDEKSSEDSLIEKINRAVEGLYYISETDAEILPFAGGKADEVSKEKILIQAEYSNNLNVEERDFTEFFERLIKIQDWFGEEETENARRFAELKDLLEQNLRDLKVFKIGSIKLDVYAVGLNNEDILMGIKTKAVET